MKAYETPKLEMIRLQSEDVLSASAPEQSVQSANAFETVQNKTESFLSNLEINLFGG